MGTVVSKAICYPSNSILTDTTPPKATSTDRFLPQKKDTNSWPDTHATYIFYMAGYLPDGIALLMNYGTLFN